MNVVFFGTPDLAIPTLERVAADHTVLAVVCQPDKAVGRSKKLQPPPVKEWADAHGVPVQQPAKLNDGGFEEWLKKLAPDVCVLVAYGRILKQSILDVPKHGFINVHPSLLPKYRGPSPIHTAVLNGDKETGVSIMRLDAGTDTGDVALQEAAPLPKNATTLVMIDTLSKLGAELSAKVLDQLAAGKAVFVKQDDSLATHTRMVVKADGAIVWARGARDLHNQIRACVPWPGAYCSYKGNTMKLQDSRVIDEVYEEPPGTIVRIEDDHLVVACGKKSLAIRSIQAPGKKMMQVADYQRGNPFAVGEEFGDG